jgi:16S rRNA (guanine966-N2)-methyltransferase
MLASMGIAPEHVLDLYAGSGALGIEALSRGASHVDFVERDVAACAAIRGNLARTGFAALGQVYCTSARAAVARLTGPYDLVFLDPPYGDPEVALVFEALAASTLLDTRTTLVYEHSRRVQAPPAIGSLALVKTRTHSDSSASFYWTAEMDEEQT